MSTANIDDVQYVLSNQTVQVPQPTNDVVTHQQPQTSAQINTRTMQYSSPYSTLLSSLNQNNETIPVPVVCDSKYSHQSYPDDGFDISEYKAWSVFNVIFCCAVIGGYSLYMSCAITEKKRQGDFIRARSYSKLVAKLNVIATISGICMFTLGALRVFGLIVM